MSFAIPVLTYHAAHVMGSDYADNDHVALAADLEVITREGFEVIALARVVDAFLGTAPVPAGRVVALSFDDGTDFDYADLPHPTHGVQRSFLNLLRDFRAANGARQPGLHATSFVVVAPEARAMLDRTCLLGAGWWSDHWWRDAVDSGLVGIGNHSWDHHHDALEGEQGDRPRGTFRSIDDFDSAEVEIAQSTRHLRAIVPNPADALFAYPYGETNEYLVREYLPAHHERIGVRAAFEGGGGPVLPTSDRWRLPRYTFRDHWRTPDGLAAILRDVAR